MQALILGATGFIGSHIVRACVAAGWTARAFRRAASPALALAGLEVESALGDLEDPASLAKAMRDCALVFHAAGFYPTRSVAQGEMQKAAARQMTNVLTAARRAGVEKVIYTSSLSTVGPAARADGLATEEDLYRPGTARHPYWEVKWTQEEIARRFAAEGLPIVILNPTAVFGPGDVKPTTGRALIMALRARCRFYPDLRTNVIDVRDVAAAHVAAAARGRPGERYILGAHNVTGRDLVAALAEVAGLPPPRWRVPLPGWLFGPARLLEHGLQRLAPQAAFLMPTLALEFSRLGGWYDSGKAQRELGWQVGRSLTETLRDAVAWFREHGYL